VGHVQCDSARDDNHVGFVRRPSPWYEEEARRKEKYFLGFRTKAVLITESLLLSLLGACGGELACSTCHVVFPKVRFNANEIRSPSVVLPSC